jgi:hypothetical protein
MAKKVKNSKQIKIINSGENEPIDEYVRDQLRNISAKFGLKIDVDNPTREQRLEAALAISDQDNGFYSMEIMVGRRVDSSEEFAQTFAMLRLAEAMNPSSNPRKFYSGFAHQYAGNEKEMPRRSGLWG